MSETAEKADVIVVGAGPAGSSTAAYLAMSGLDVLLLEKTSFPREKVCGDGLTPRAVKELITLGIPTPEEEGWIRNKGLRIIGGGMRLQLDWPDLASFPPYGLVRTRQDFDDILAKHAVKHGARLRESTNVTGPIRDESGRITGVTAKASDEKGRAVGPEQRFEAPLVIAADGNSSRLSMAMGREKRDDRPMGVAVRTYYTSPRHDDDYLESWLELWSSDDEGNKILLPGYGWIFGVGDGTSNVGLGILNTSSAFGKTDYKDVMRRWVATMPKEWTYSDETMVGPIRGAALPMGFNRQPHYRDGLLLVGDAGGMVNPFNGEGIAYAMESGRLASEVIAQAFARGDDAGRERVLASYPAVMKDDLGGYYTLGRWFASAIGHPEVMRLATKYGLPRTTLMKLLLKIMANLAEPRGGSASDRLIVALSKMAPDA
ncbi:geranylgeranyl reductase family protein [Nostocoides australiense]|uniref:Geranylgeranyl reductase family n=1 Tax=Nostocoides australiense Ben110 TaxID=1193182 RepID=W6JVK7_9MICO|nr:geranylgeranyl reductase family protein [Tetrasphaera australiensis]MCA0290608.1 geranylgeranyl reductase family protein [Actinomycetota bacterium]MCB1301813.1 geranylgeranyl reductase family protein [Tetrasphaera sp.]CCH72716.1 Geranylgeranyl reductase family [Tetrasphaera australiensis Ben110]HPF80752.1 geranylgeranyl reductase family protein [Tetrasphaera australiensis]HRW01287.1 geranylgeranyl reductase family protein [Tetrasphaera sp.]